MLIEGQRYYVYRNLTKKCWSVRDLKTRKVVAHLNRLLLTKVEFKVSEAGRQRVLRERRKNVHAGAIGTFRTRGWLNPNCDRQIRYNPYKSGHFYHAINGRKIERTEEAVFGRDGHVRST